GAGGGGGQGGCGSGLGVVRHFVALHGGSVYAESPGQGKGATFVVKLPLMVAEMLERPIAARDGGMLGPSLAGARVVVVDDDPLTVELITEVLIQVGADVIECRTTDEALEAITQRR